MVIVGSSGAWGALTPFSESYSSYSETTGWTTGTGGRFTPSILSEGDNYFLSVDQTSRNNNGAIVTGTILSGKAAAGDNFTLTFDMRLSSSSDQTATEFIIYDASGQKLFSLKETGKWVTTWYLNGSATQITLPNSNKAGSTNSISDVTWCSYKISFKEGVTYLTITNKETSETIFERQPISGGSTGGGLGNIQFVSSRYLANFAIDNIVLRSIQDGDVPALPIYTIKYVDASSNEIKTDRISAGEAGSAASIIDGDKVAIYANDKKYVYDSDDAAGKTIASDGSTVVTIKFREAEIYSYSVKTIAGEATDVLASGTTFEGDAVTVSFSQYLLKGTTLYNITAFSSDDWYRATFTPNADNFVQNLNYNGTTIPNVVFFSEGEAISGVSVATNATRASNGQMGHTGSETTYKEVTTLAPGRYKIFGRGVNGNSAARTANFKVGEGAPVWSFNIPNGNNTTGNSEEFYANNEVLSFACTGSSISGLDWLYIQRTGEAPLNKGEWVADTIASAAQSFIGDSITLTMTDATIADDGGAKYLYFAEGGTLKLTSVKDGYGFEKIVLNATKLAGATPVWTGNEKEVTFTFTGETKINSIVIGKDGKLAELPTAATIAEFKATTEETLLTLTGAEVLEKGDDYTIIQDATGGLKLDGIVLDAPKGQKLAGTIAGIYAGNAELVNGTQTDYASPKANGSAQTPTEMTAEEAKTADNIYRLVTLKGVTIRNNGSTITATDKTGSITVDAGTLTLADGDVLASLTGVTYADGLLKATASQSGLLWKADDLAAGQALPVSLTAATYVGKLADVAMGDAITIETLGAGTIEVQNAAGQSIVKYVLTQAENTLHFPVTADMVSDIQKHGLQLVGEGVNVVMAYKLPGLYAANMNENTIWYSDDNFAVGDLITLGAIHFPDVREGDKLENKELTEAEAAFQQDSPYNVISFGAVVDFEKLAVRDDKAEAKEGEEFAQGGYQSTNGMVMSFGGLTEGQSYSFKEAYPAVNKFAAVTEGIDQFPVDNNNKAYDPAQGNVPTKGTFYVFNPTKDGVVNVTVDLEKGKKLYVTENGEAFGEYMGITEVHDNTISFSVKAGNTYHLFANETNLKYYGFTFTPNDPAAMDVANSIYVFKRLGNVKNAKLMLEDAQVTCIKGDNVFVEDASGAIDLFQTLIQFYVGQKLNGYIFGENIKDFPMLLRTNETPNSQFKAEMGTAQSKTITVAEAKKREAMFRFVTLKNLKLAKDKQGFKVLIDEVGDTIYIEDTFNVLYELPNKIKRIEGIIGFNNEGVHYIWPTSKEGIVPADEPATLETGKYYLKNVGSGLFWGAGNDWGTRGSLLKHAEYVTLLAQGDGVYKMETQVSNGGTAYYFEGDYMDNANPMSLTINKTKTEGVYTIASPEEKLFGYDGTSTVLGKDVAAGENAQWQILSEADMQATLSAAAADAPVDATFLILDPNFGRNNRNQSAWTVSEDCTNKNLSGGNNTNNCAESYMSVFTISQTIDVPNGKYVLNAQAAVTFHDNREIKEYDGNGYPQIFANDKVSNFNDMIVEDRLSNMGKLSEQFTAGMYTVEPIEVIVTDGKLTIGAKSERADIWAIWDNFELTYYGPANADGVLLQLDFENGEAADYWQKGVGYLVTPDFEGTTGQAASIKSGSDRGDYILTEANYAGVGDYNVDLDFAICKGSKTAFFAVMSESSWIFDYTWNNWGYFWKTTTTSDGQVHNPYLFELTIPSGTTAYVNEQYDAQETGLANVNGGTWDFTEKNWYHLNLKVKADNKTVGYTVTDKATGAQALSGTYTMRDGESIYMKGIYERNNRMNADPGSILFDNIVVSTGSGPVTAIETVNAETAVRFAEGVYNLRGQKVGNSLQGLKKGLYIVNGKKVSVK